MGGSIRGQFAQNGFIVGNLLERCDAAGLADRPREAGLLAAEPPERLTIERAGILSSAFVSVATRFK